MQQYYVSLCLETHVWMSKDNLDCHPKAPSQFHLRQDILPAQNTAHMPGQLAHDFQGSARLCLPTCHSWYCRSPYLVGFYVNSGDLNSGPFSSKTSTFLTESFPHPEVVLFIFIYHSLKFLKNNEIRGRETNYISDYVFFEGG